tara:strand:+ start:528 stop:968 length:441 start_codon:yes stop_codon:yes gene_type:complete
MIKNIILIIVLNFIIAGETTNINGENWKSWNLNRKVGFIDGFINGYLTYSSLVDSAKNIEKKRNIYWFPPLIITMLESYSEENITKISKFESVELTKRLDAFYYEPDNYGIAINNAIKIVNLREMGKGKIAEDFILDCQKKYLKGR